MFLFIYFYSEVFVKKQIDSLVQDYKPLHAILIVCNKLLSDLLPLVPPQKSRCMSTNTLLSHIQRCQFRALPHMLSIHDLLMPLSGNILQIWIFPFNLSYLFFLCKFSVSVLVTKLFQCALLSCYCTLRLGRPKWAAVDSVELGLVSEALTHALIHCW